MTEKSRLPTGNRTKIPRSSSP